MRTKRGRFEKPQYTIFKVGDKVIWNPKCLPKDLPENEKKYGKGPFDIVEIEAPASKTGICEEHPQWVTICANNKLERFSGYWFIKET